jgi:putative inorganic carbon (hco3(-)) transporter
VMMLPLVFYLLYTARRVAVKWALAICILLMGFAILGTQSRGALIALFVMASFLGLKSNHPVRASIVIAMTVAIAVAFMPDSWSSRMDTIKSYREDTSAMSRIYTWVTIWNLSMDRPFFGGGFGTDTLNVFQRYAPTEPPYHLFTGTVFVAHSIYLQALGEHGFPGLLLYLLLGWMTWRMATRTSKMAKNDPEFKDWVPLLMRMSQVSLMGFASGGAFLSLMHLDVTYYIMGLIFMTHASVRESQAAKAKLGVAPTSMLHGPAERGGAVGEGGAGGNFAGGSLPGMRP